MCTRLRTTHHRGWSARQLQPDAIARDIARSIAAHAAQGTSKPATDYTDNPVILSKVYALLSK
jgi:hypothetical protein